MFSENGSKYRHVASLHVWGWWQKNQDQNYLWIFSLGLSVKRKEHATSPEKFPRLAFTTSLQTARFRADGGQQWPLPPTQEGTKPGHICHNFSLIYSNKSVSNPFLTISISDHPTQVKLIPHPTRSGFSDQPALYQLCQIVTTQSRFTPSIHPFSSTPHPALFNPKVLVIKIGLIANSFGSPFRKCSLWRPAASVLIAISL